MPQLHALLVGINNYHPDSGVSSLQGCVNDVNEMQKFLKKNYAAIKPRLKILKNEKATRSNIINTFVSHLTKKATAGDTILFYYSGHGSYADTADDFKKYDPKAQDETLVCYDSRIPGNYDLADKEIAVMLSEIEAGVNIVLIVDACHSASITRAIENNMNLPRRRFTSGRDDSRGLSSYMSSIDNFYTAQLAATGQITIPRTPHAVFSACDRDQEAWESFDDRGLFSKNLLNILEKNPNISYSDLFFRVRQAIKQEVKDQDPKFQSNENFDHNKVFLLNDSIPNQKRHRVYFSDNKWRMDYGAIHGLPIDPNKVRDIQIALYPANKTEMIGTVGVEAVMLKESVINFPEGEKNTNYDAEIVSLPTGMAVYLEGSAKNKSAFQKIYKKAPSPFIQLVEELGNSKYKLKIEKDKLVVYLCENGKLLHGRMNKDEGAIAYITGILENIEEWERLANLDNKKTKFKKKDIELAFYEESEEHQLTLIPGDKVTMDYPPRGEDKDEEGDPIGLLYQVKAKNNSKRKLYFSLIHLDSNFAAKAVYPCQEIDPQSDWITLDDENAIGITDENNADEITEVIKLIVSTEEFDDYKFRAEGFTLGEIAKPTRAIIPRKAPRKKAEQDWCTRTITVNTIRRSKGIAKEDVTFEKEKITIKGHSKFKASVSFAPIKTHTKSVHPLARLPQIFQGEDFEVLNLTGRSRSTDPDRSIVELSGIENIAALKKEPLEIIVDQPLKEEEHLIPLTFDGEFIIPFGEVHKDGTGKTHISISDLPTMPDPGRRRKKSVPKALWFCLLKFTGFRELAFRLRYVQYNKKGKVNLSSRNINDKVAKANKILVVVHGIIGATKPMAQNLRFLLDEKRYDLILAFDYENLNESLEKTAEEFNKALTEAGLHAKDGKQLDIVAHSMGGLVSRYLIENLRKGDQLVDHLIMFGTPNGGSAFGSIPQYRDMFTDFLSLALNFGKVWLGPVYAYLEGLNKILQATKPITITLDQMSEKNPFVKNLYKNDKPATQYIAIAGDISNYKVIADKRIARFMEKMSLKAGRLAYGSQPNDIAVSVQQIHHIPPSFDATTQQLICHHMNYFEEGEGLEMLRKCVPI